MQQIVVLAFEWAENQICSGCKVRLARPAAHSTSTNAGFLRIVDEKRLKFHGPCQDSLQTRTHLSVKSLCVPSRSHSLKKAAGLR